MNKISSAKAKKTKSSKILGGAFILLIAGIICKLLGAFYRVPLSNILGSEGIGIYQLVFPVYSLILILSSGGVPVALSKIVAECRARGETERAKRFLLIAFLLLFVLSGIFSVVFVFCNEYIAALQGNSLAATGYIAISVALVFSSILTAFRGYFQGYQIMYPTAVSQIIEQAVKLVLGLVLAGIFARDGIAFGVFGALLGITISEVLSLVYLMITYFVKRIEVDVIEPEIKHGFWSDLWLLVKRSFPITLNSLILPLILAVDSFLVINLLMKSGYTSAQSTSLFGVYSGMVNSLINFPTVAALAISVAILPAIAYNAEKGEKSSQAISTCLKIILVISIPCILVYILFSNNIMSILYPHATDAETLKVASYLLKISAINILTISFLQVSTSIMQASGRSFIPLINLAFAGAVKIILTIYLVASPMNIYGAAVASIMCYILSSGLNLISLRGRIQFEIGAKRIASVFLASGLAVAIMVGVYNLFNLITTPNLSFIFAGVTAAVIYAFALLVLPVFTMDEMKYVPYGQKLCLIKSKFRIKALDDEVLK